MKFNSTVLVETKNLNTMRPHVTNFDLQTCYWK